ncbi:MAG: PAS domain S-box protein [bacterium]
MNVHPRTEKDLLKENRRLREELREAREQAERASREAEALRERLRTVQGSEAQTGDEHLQVGEAVQAERKRLFDVLETLPTMICLLTPDYHVPFANRSFREKFGESKGRHCYEYCWGRNAPCDFCESYGVLKTKRPHHWEVTGPDGSVIDVYDFPFTDVDGSPMILEMDIDITERKRAEEALRASEEKFARAFAMNPAAVILSRLKDGVYLDVNETCLKMLGYKRNEMLGRSSLDLHILTPEGRFRWVSALRKTGRLRDWEQTAFRKSGEAIQTLVSGEIVNIDGEETILSTWMDITGRKKMEEDLRRSRDELEALVQERTRELLEAHEEHSSQLLASLEGERRYLAKEIHDSIGQILAAIKYRIEGALLEAEKRKGKAKLKPLQEIIPTIQNSIEEARRFQASLHPPVLEDLGLLAAIRWFCREYEVTFPRIRVSDEIQISEKGVPDSLRVVIFRIVQEAMNNAGKHSQAGTVRLRLGKTDGNIELVVQDDGEGFDVSKAQNGPLGKGFGLISMKERAHHSGGTLSIESVQGRGTTIRAVWPLLG